MVRLYNCTELCTHSQHRQATVCCDYAVFPKIILGTPSAARTVRAQRGHSGHSVLGRRVLHEILFGAENGARTAPAQGEKSMACWFCVCKIILGTENGARTVRAQSAHSPRTIDHCEKADALCTKPHCAQRMVRAQSPHSDIML